MPAQNKTFFRINCQMGFKSVNRLIPFLDSFRFCVIRIMNFRRIVPFAAPGLQTIDGGMTYPTLPYSLL
jgi:hypothetical protein